MLGQSVVASAWSLRSEGTLTSYNGQTVSHDPDGNLLSAPTQGTLLGALTWDTRNRLISAGGVTYTYDAESRRKTSTTGGQTTQYVWSRGSSLDRLLAKLNPDGSVTRYVYGTGLLYEETTSSGGTAQSPVYYHFDWRGDTVALSDGGGNVTARLSYSPYGERTIESGTVTTPFCFNGQWGVMTAPNGLLSMQARYYSPVLRRFLNEDPAGFAGGVNLYAFAAGDPIDYMDPFGLGPVSALSRIGGGFQALGGGIEAVLGFGFAGVTAETGVGIVAGVAVGLHGVDQFQAGWRKAFGETNADTLTSAGLQAVGFSPTAAHLTDAGISIIGTAGIGFAEQAAARTAPELGSKLEYFLGNGSGNAHNIERSTGMLRQLESVGLQDTAATRQLLTEHLTVS